MLVLIMVDIVVLKAHGNENEDKNSIFISL